MFSTYGARVDGESVDVVVVRLDNAIKQTVLDT